VDDDWIVSARGLPPIAHTLMSRSALRSICRGIAHLSFDGPELRIFPSTARENSYHLLLFIVGERRYRAVA
jgi:hypothetical protein